MEIATISDVARQFGRATATMSRSVATLREVLKKRSKDARSDKR
jgi:hypothetical protein